MRSIRSWGVRSLLQLALALCVAPQSWAQLVEVEPNDACASAQDVGFLMGAASIGGNLALNDVDFFRFSATPGQRVSAAVMGGFTVAVSIRQSDCGWLPVENPISPIAATFVVPADGVVVVMINGGVSSLGLPGGPYMLSLAVQPPPIGSIRGRVVDALRRQPLAGSTPPFAQVELFRCQADACSEQVGVATAGEDGRFLFQTGFGGRPLPVGSYLVRASAQEFQTADRGPFAVAEAQDLELGDIGLAPPPIRLVDVRPCVIPARGGICRYSVTLQNNTDASLRGTAWSVVNATGVAGPVVASVFEASAMNGVETVRRIDVSVGPRRSQVLTFQFDVPASVPVGASFCADAYLGPRPSPLVAPLRRSSLFCVAR
jgi:hypothetical protein